MQITRFSQAEPYQAPGHFDMRGLRLQGLGASQTENFWVGYSQFLPAGGAKGDLSPFEKVYVVLEGEMTVIEEDKEVILGPLDSCHIGPNAKREIVNNTNHVVKMLVIMPNPKEST